MKKLLLVCFFGMLFLSGCMRDKDSFCRSKGYQEAYTPAVITCPGNCDDPFCCKDYDRYENKVTQEDGGFEMVKIHEALKNVCYGALPNKSEMR
jgi:hypothetical protein